MAIIQILKFVTPLITFPYLTRVLGVEAFGNLAYASGLIIYLTLIVEFGFNKISVINASKLKENKEYLSEYIYTIFSTQLILYFSSMILVFISYIFFPFSIDFLYLIVILSLSSFGLIFTPSWLFLGIEKIKALVPFTIIGRLISIPLIIFFVKGPDDILIAGLIQSSAFLISGFICTIYLIKNKYLLRYKFKFNNIISALKDSSLIFITNFASNMYMAAVPIIIGLILGPVYVAYYKVADNIKAISLNLMSPIFNAVYSRFNNLYNRDINESRIFLKKYFRFSLILSICGASILFIYSKNIITIIAGEEYLPGSIVLKIQSLVIIFSVLNQFLGTQTLIPLKYHKQFSIIVCIGGITSLIFIYPLIYNFSIIGAAISVLISEILIFILLLHTHKNKEINILF